MNMTPRDPTQARSVTVIWCHISLSTATKPAAFTIQNADIVLLFVYFDARSSRSLAKRRRRAQIPRYSFQRHQRDVATTTIYSPHVLILEGIFALYDQRVLDMLDMRIFAEADADVCLGRRSQSSCRDMREGLIEEASLA